MIDRNNGWSDRNVQQEPTGRMKQTIGHALDSLSKSASENECDSLNNQTIAPSVETEVDIPPSCDADSSMSSSFTPIPTVSNDTDATHSTDFVFKSLTS